MNRSTVFGSAVAVVGLLVSLSIPAYADDYSWMLGVLNSNRIDGQVGSGASGNVSVNTAAGAGNLQINQRVLQQAGVPALAAVSPSAGVSNGSVAPSVSDRSGQVAQTEIGGQAFSHASGFLGINQVSGVGNAQLNTIVVGGVNQSLGQIRATEGGSTPSQLPNPADRHADQPVAKKDAPSRYSATISDGALSGFGGVLQINQVSGIGNVTANHFSISMP